MFEVKRSCDKKVLQPSFDSTSANYSFKLDVQMLLQRILELHAWG